MSSSTQSSPTNRSREESNNQPHHVMTQPVFLQKIFPFVASKPSTPLFFKSITSSWSETVVHYHGALWCWGALFKEYSGDDDGEHDDDNGSSVHEDNDDSSGGDDSSDNHGNTVRDRSAAEIFRLLETCFREIEHPDSLWIIDTVFKLLEQLKVRIRKEDIDTPHFEAFGALFDSKVSAQSGKTLTFFDKLFGFFDCRAMLPDVLTEFRPYDLPQHMDEVLTRISDKIEELELEDHLQNSERFEKLAAFLHACFNWFPRNCVVANHLFRRHTPKHQLGDRDRSGKLALVVFDVDNPVTDNVLAFALEHSTPEIVRLVVSFLTSYGLDKVLMSDDEEDRSRLASNLVTLRRSILIRAEELIHHVEAIRDRWERSWDLRRSLLTSSMDSELDMMAARDRWDRSSLQRSLLTEISDFKLAMMTAIVNGIISGIGGDRFVQACNSENVYPYFAVAVSECCRNVEKVALLIKRIGEIGGDEAVKSFIEVQSVIESDSEDHHLTGKSSIHFAIEYGQPEMLKYLLKVAEGFGQEYLKSFISLLGHSADSCDPSLSLYLPPLYFALCQSNSHVTEIIVDKLRSLGDYFLRGQIDSMFDGESEFSHSKMLVTSLLKVVDASEVKLLLERNLKKYKVDDDRNFIRQLEGVKSAEWLVNLIAKVDAVDFFCQYMSAICEEHEEDKEYIPYDILQYLEQALKLMELDRDEVL